MNSTWPEVSRVKVKSIWMSFVWSPRNYTCSLSSRQYVLQMYSYSNNQKNEKIKNNTSKVSAVGRSILTVVFDLETEKRETRNIFKKRLFDCISTVAFAFRPMFVALCYT